MSLGTILIVSLVLMLAGAMHQSEMGFCAQWRDRIGVGRLIDTVLVGQNLTAK